MLAVFITVILGLQRQHDSLPTSPLFLHPLHRGVMCTQARFSMRRRRCGLVVKPENLKTEPKRFPSGTAKRNKLERAIEPYERDIGFGRFAGLDRISD